jgi:ATP-dependent Lon protease
VHVHVPAGAVPKDGPSAGVTMTTALVSLVTGRAARSDTAMTGEITLTGHVLPIGGLKEKALAAQRAGIARVIAPKLNEPDIDEFPQHLLDDIEFAFVDHVDEVLKEALEPESKAARGPRAVRRAPRERAAARGR